MKEFVAYTGAGGPVSKMSAEEAAEISFRNKIGRGNKVIADFMGLKSNGLLPMLMGDGDYCFAYSLGYHRDWNDVIEVAKKWRSVMEGKAFIDAQKRKDYGSRTASLEDAILSYDITAVWTILVDNIIWFNEATK